MLKIQIYIFMLCIYCCFSHIKKKILGGDDHDYKLHYRKQQPRGDDLDYKPHRRKLHGKKNSDYQPYKRFGAKSDQFGHVAAFKEFMSTFNKTYESKHEYKKRYAVFKQNMKEAYILQKNEQGSAKYGITKFADWTEAEFRTLLGFRPDLKSNITTLEKPEMPDIQIPIEFDWRDKGVVTSIKNQGMCGSCWAFSVTGNVEGQWALKHGTLYSLSEQELVDCDKLDQGCNGGLPENAYKEIQKLGGLETEDAYPYEAENEKCHLDPLKLKVQVNGSVELPQDEVGLAQWLVQNGPISIGINANALQGYYRIYRGDGSCGVNIMATSATVP